MVWKLVLIGHIFVGNLGKSKVFLYIKRGLTGSVRPIWVVHMSEPWVLETNCHCSTMYSIK